MRPAAPTRKRSGPSSISRRSAHVRRRASGPEYGRCTSRSAALGVTPATCGSPAPGSIIGKLADTVSKNGNLLLNLSPKADGTIPRSAAETLLEIGQWLDVNGDAIYGTHNWIEFGEGGGRGQQGLHVRFTVKGDILYAIILGNWPGEQAIIPRWRPGQAPEGKITSVSMLGNDGNSSSPRTPTD